MNFFEQQKLLLQQQLQQHINPGFNSNPVKPQMFYYDPGLVDQNKLLMLMLFKHQLNSLNQSQQQDDINAAQLLLSLSQPMTQNLNKNQSMCVNHQPIQTTNSQTINNSSNQKPLLKPHPKFRAKVNKNFNLYPKI